MANTVSTSSGKISSMRAQREATARHAPADMVTSDGTNADDLDDIEEPMRNDPPVDQAEMLAEELTIILTKNPGLLASLSEKHRAELAGALKVKRTSGGKAGKAKELKTTYYTALHTAWETWQNGRNEAGMDRKAESENPWSKKINGTGSTSEPREVTNAEKKSLFEILPSEPRIKPKELAAKLGDDWTARTVFDVGSALVAEGKAEVKSGGVGLYGKLFFAPTKRPPATRRK
jgi:hypothetical protein